MTRRFFFALFALLSHFLINSELGLTNPDLVKYFKNEEKYSNKNKPCLCSDCRSLPPILE